MFGERRLMKILLPIDGSDAAIEAIEFVRSLAMSNPINVAVMVVSYEPVHYTLQSWKAEWVESETLRSQHILTSAKERLAPHCLSVSVIRESGAVVACILDQAKQSEVDLIVVGAKGHSAMRRVLLGSVSDSVATRAECSVVVVRPSENKKHRLDKILLAYDKSKSSSEAMTELMQLELDRQSQVTVVSVALNPYIFVGDGYVTSPIALTPEQLTPIRETAAQMVTQISARLPITDAETPTADHVGEAIVEIAEKRNVDLILIGDSAHSRIGEFFIGSTSKYVLRHAPCSVWISRHHWKSEEAK